MVAVKFLVVVVILFVEGTSCKRVSFRDCGNGEVVYVDVEPCSEEPCSLKRGQTVYATGDGIASKNASAATLAMTFKLLRRDVDYRGAEPDVCKLLQCPIEAGKEYNVLLPLKVPALVPSVSTKATSGL